MIASALKALTRNENDDISSAGSFNEADWDDTPKKTKRRPQEPNVKVEQRLIAEREQFAKE